MILAGPMFLELFLNTMLNNVDTLMLSHYDEFAVGAVGNANTILFMMNIFFNVIATATTVVVAQYLGAKKFDKMNMIYTLSFVVNLAFGVVLSGAFCLANPLIMQFLRVSPEMHHYSMMYLYIVGGGGFVTAVFNVMLQIVRCNGHTKIGMRVTLCPSWIWVSKVLRSRPLSHDSSQSPHFCSSSMPAGSAGSRSVI